MKLKICFHIRIKQGFLLFSTALTFISRSISTVWQENMGLYMIEWKDSESKKIDGFKKFMGMTAAELANEAWKKSTLIGNHIICI
jgi:hypothetical protein